MPEEISNDSLNDSLTASLNDSSNDSFNSTKSEESDASNMQTEIDSIMEDDSISDDTNDSISDNTITDDTNDSMSYNSPNDNFTDEHSIKDDSRNYEEIEYIENVSIGNYKIIKVLGKGSSAKVVLAVDQESGESVAIKIINRDSNVLSEKRIFREILISSLLNHPHIVRLLNFFYNPSYFFIVFEYVKGKQLYDVVISNSKIEEKDARRYFRQIISAVDYIHRNSIAHRDLKIENILIDQNDNVRIIDFGLSNFYDNKNLLSTFCGSLYFAAPELLMGQRYCGPEVDVWSLGVVLYVMLCGRVPFDDESIHALQNKIKTCEFEFFRSISADAKDLILNMIIANSSGRYGIDQVKDSEWINKGYETKINNYMNPRHPLKKINNEFVKALSISASFQFSDVEEDLLTYIQICKNSSGSLEEIYWSRKPTISLYYLILEKSYNSNKNSRLLPKNRYSHLKKTELSKKHLPEILQNFVNFLIYTEAENPYSRFFSKSIFKHESLNSPKLNDKMAKLPNYPSVRKSYLKGVFKGIKVKNVKCSNALKKIILDVFLTQNIIYEANEKSYFCSYNYNGEECYFKLTMYYNMIVAEHYLVLNCLNSKKTAFKVVYNIIRESLKISNK